MKIIMNRVIDVRDKTLIQASILGLGQITAKILSLIFLFRFAKDLGKEGMSLYAYAYVPFSIFADLSCLGLIPGTSKLISQLKANNEEEKARYLLWRGTLYAIVIGAFFFLFMLFFSRQILTISLFNNLNENTFKAVRINLLYASISLFLIPLIHFYKGFLQGNLKMYPSCLSLIAENIVKVVAYLLLSRYFNIKNYIHFAFIVYFSSYICSIVILLISIRPYYHGKKTKFKALITLLKTSVPFGIATMFFTIYQFIDSISLPVLLPVEGYYSAYMFETIRLIFFPIVIAQAMGGALNPKINYMFKEDRIEEANTLAKVSSMGIIYILIPLTVIMRFFSNEIYYSFYHQEAGGTILYHIAILILFFGIYKVLIGISLGLPRGFYIILATIISAVVKYILNYLFVPNYGYLGAIYATIIAISVCILVAYVVLHLEGMHIFFVNVKAVLKSMLAIIISVILVLFVRLCFSLRAYPIYYTIVLYSILILSLYYLILKFLKQNKALRHTIN